MPSLATALTVAPPLMHAMGLHVQFSLQSDWRCFWGLVDSRGLPSLGMESLQLLLMHHWGGLHAVPRLAMHSCGAVLARRGVWRPLLLAVQRSQLLLCIRPDMLTPLSQAAGIGDHSQLVPMWHVDDSRLPQGVQQQLAAVGLCIKGGAVSQTSAGTSKFVHASTCQHRVGVCREREAPSGSEQGKRRSCLFLQVSTACAQSAPRSFWNSAPAAGMT